MLLYCDHGEQYCNTEGVQAAFNQWLPAYKQQVQHCRHPPGHKVSFPVYLGAFGIDVWVAWWSLSFKFTWYFRSKEVKFIRGHIMEDIMGFGTIFFPSSWICNKDPHSRNITSPVDSSEKLPSSIPAASVYSKKSTSSREIFSLGTDRVEAKQTRCQERVKLIPKVKFFYSPSRENFFPVSCLWMKEE